MCLNPRISHRLEVKNTNSKTLNIKKEFEFVSNEISGKKSGGGESMCSDSAAEESCGHSSRGHSHCRNTAQLPNDLWEHMGRWVRPLLLAELCREARLDVCAALFIQSKLRQVRLLRKVRVGDLCVAWFPLRRTAVTGTVQKIDATVLSLSSKNMMFYIHHYSRYSSYGVIPPLHNTHMRP